MPSIADYQQRRVEFAESESAALDIDLLLAEVLDRPRYYLYAHPQHPLSAVQCAELEALIARRRAGEPIAHLLGRAEFWGLALAVSAATLIPRPDTEVLVEWLLELYPPGSECQVLDLGTGTGAIALALASERPRWTVTGVDRVAAAVALARSNAARLGLDRVRFLHSDWFAAIADQRFDIIVSNPPYIEVEDPHLQRGDVRFEPHSALVSGVDGLDDIRRIITAARDHLAPGGALLLEHGYRQAPAIAELLGASGYTDIALRHDYGANPRATLGRYAPVPIKEA